MLKTKARKVKPVQCLSIEEVRQLKPGDKCFVVFNDVSGKATFVNLVFDSDHAYFRGQFFSGSVPLGGETTLFFPLDGSEVYRLYESAQSDSSHAFVV